MQLPSFHQRGTFSEPMGSKEEQLAVVEDRIRANEFDYIIASDGSKLGEGSYGKTGAAAVIYKESIENPPSTLKVSLGTESNSYYAEMKGIELGLKYMRNVEEPSKALFLSDCTSALKSSCYLLQGNTPALAGSTSSEQGNLRRWATIWKLCGFLDTAILSQMR